MKKKISIGRTYNLGNYESLRLDVGFEDESSRSWLDVYEDCKQVIAKMEQDQNVVPPERRHNDKHSR